MPVSKISPKNFKKGKAIQNHHHAKNPNQPFDQHTLGTLFQRSFIMAFNLLELKMHPTLLWICFWAFVWFPHPIRKLNKSEMVGTLSELS